MGSPGLVLDSLFDAGVAALEAGHSSEAVQSLTALVNTAPDYYRPGTGSAAYWAGRALDQVKRSRQATKVWLIGMRALQKTGRIAPRPL